MEFGGNDCSYNWREISENPDKEHYSKSSITEFIEIYSYLIDEFKKIGKEPVLLSLPPIDSTKYFDYISKKLNTDNILKLMEGNKRSKSEMVCSFFIPKKKGVRKIATTGIWKIEKRLDNVIDYTTNIEKTINSDYGKDSYYDWC